MLSRAGKITVIKTVHNSLPTYYMGIFKMPKMVAKKIIQLQKTFLWSSAEKGRGMAMVRWKIIQKPKEFGGVDVGDLLIKNATLLFKWL